MTILMHRRDFGTAVLGLVAQRLPLAATLSQKVRVLSTADRMVVQPVIDDFERTYSGYSIDYVQLGSVELHAQFLADQGAHADLLWSSALDLQIKLVNDGYALRYESPHADFLPRWAMWKNEAYGTTHEPVGIAYHKRLLAQSEVPATHLALAALLRSDIQRFRDRVATYDIEQAGLGYLTAAHDAMVSPRSWELVRALARCRASLHIDTQSMLESVAKGQSALAYNVLGTYADAYARTNPDMGVAYLQDYTFVISRVAFIARKAPNPQGAKLWLDHLLSQTGQRLLAETGKLYGVRTDMTGPRSSAALKQLLGSAARPIAIGPGLIANLDHSKRRALLKRWYAEFENARN
jgi:iron(III) transport system substrate-binding protein